MIELQIFIGLVILVLAKYLQADFVSFLLGAGVGMVWSGLMSHIIYKIKEWLDEFYYYK